MRSSPCKLNLPNTRPAPQVLRLPTAPPTASRSPPIWGRGRMRPLPHVPRLKRMLHGNQPLPARSSLEQPGRSLCPPPVEPRLRSAEDIAGWFDEVHPILVAEENDQIIAFGSTSTYRPRACYAGIAEVSVYVARHARGRGVGRVVLQALMDAAREAGFWK